MVSSVLDWIKSNPLVIWPLASAVASLIYTKLEAYPRTHGVFAFLASMGLDLPKMLAMLQKALTGKDPRPPPSGPVGSQRTAPTVPPAAKPPVVQRIACDGHTDDTAAIQALFPACIAFAVVCCALAVVGGLLSGCALLKGSTLPADLEQNFVCVQGEIASGVTNVMAIEQKCLPGQLGTIVDMIETLIASPKFAAEHPAQMPALHDGIVGARASMARDK